MASRVVSSGLPAAIGREYTKAQAAVLAVVAREAWRSGACSLGHGCIARLAGVGRTTVRDCIRRAETLGHLKVGRRLIDGEENVISIDLDAWAALDAVTDQ